MNNSNYQFLAYEPGIPCHTVATHYNVHPEEAASIVALKYHGDELHPGIVDAIENKQFLFVDAGATSYKGKSWRHWHKEGVVFIGTMGSPYDEHYLPEEIRENECSATLVARALDLGGGELKKMFDGLVKSDRGSENDFLSFSSHLRRATLLHSYSIEDQTKLLEFAMMPFDWIFTLQNRFFHESLVECKEKAVVERINYKGVPIRVAFIQSDDPQVPTVAKTRSGVSANVVVCKNSNGHVFISISSYPIIDLSLVARSLKIEEMKIKRMRFDPYDPRLLEEGCMIGLDEWHFQKEAQRIFNGSLSSPNRPATKITPERMVSIILRALQEPPRTGNLSSVPGFKKLEQLNFKEKV